MYIMGTLKFLNRKGDSIGTYLMYTLQSLGHMGLIVKLKEA